MGNLFMIPQSYFPKEMKYWRKTVEEKQICILLGFWAILFR